MIYPPDLPLLARHFIASGREQTPALCAATDATGAPHTNQRDKEHRATLDRRCRRPRARRARSLVRAIITTNWFHDNCKPQRVPFGAIFRRHYYSSPFVCRVPCPVGTYMRTSYNYQSLLTIVRVACGKNKPRTVEKYPRVISPPKTVYYAWRSIGGTSRGHKKRAGEESCARGDKLKAKRV